MQAACCWYMLARGRPMANRDNCLIYWRPGVFMRRFAQLLAVEACATHPCAADGSTLLHPARTD
jgi:hypothetical protein